MSKKNLIILFLLVLLGSFLTGCSTETKKVSYESIEYTYTVNTGYINLNTKYVGTIQSEKQTFLGFKLPGRIINILVDEGVYVKAGQLLALLDGSEVKTQYNSAKQMLDALWTVYNSTKQMFDAQINAMKAKVQQAKTAMEGLKIGLKDTKNISEEQLKTAKKQVEQAKIGLDTAKTNLEHTKTILSQKEKDIYSNSKNAISQADIILTNFLLFVDKIVGVSDENRNFNNAFEVYLGAKNTALKEQVKSEWLDLNLKYEKLKPQIKQLLIDLKDINNLSEETKQKVYETLTKLYDILVDARKLGKDFFNLLEDSISGTTLPLSTLNSWKKQTIDFQNNIEKVILTVQGEYILGVKGSIQAIENFKKESQAKLDLLQKQYDLAKKQYETAKQTYNQYLAMSKGKVNEVSTKFEVAKKQYEEALKGLQALEKQKQAQLSQIMSQIQQVKGNKDLAAVNLGNIKLFAPYDGIILEKMAEVGQVVGAGTPIFKFASPSDIKVVFYVPVEQLSNYTLGDEIKIKVNDKFYTGYISKISQQIDPYSRKVKIEAKFYDIVDNVKLNMFVDVYPKNNKLGGIVIPYSLIKYKYGKPYVFIKSGTGYIVKYIDVIKCDNENCLVKGLTKGDIVK